MPQSKENTKSGTHRKTMSKLNTLPRAFVERKMPTMIVRLATAATPDATVQVSQVALSVAGSALARLHM